MRDDMTNPITSIAGAIAAMLVACGAHGAYGATIYRENFPNTVGQTAVSAVGWTALYGNATTNVTSASTGSTGTAAMLSGGPSAPTPGANVNAGDPTAQTAKGFVPIMSPDGAQDFLVYTDEYAIDRAANAPATFQWYAASVYAGDAQRLAVRVGGNWYAQATSHAPVAIGSTQGIAAAQQVVAPFSTGGWVAVAAAAGAPLTLGTTVGALPDGAITAFGIYAELADAFGTTAERTYLDTFEVTTTPEPSTLAAIAGAAIVLARRRARR